MTLVVVHRDHAVELTPTGPQEERVGRQRTGHGDARGGESRHRGRHDPRLLVAEQPPLAAVRVDGGHRDPRRSTEQRHEQVGQPPAGRLDARRRQPCNRRPQRLVKGRMHHAEPTATTGGIGGQPEHHRRCGVRQAAGPGEQFGVAGHVVAGGMEGLLVERARHDGGGMAGAGGGEGHLDGPGCRRPTGCGDCSGHDGF